MKGRSIILAGGSGGLGQAVAEALAARGAIPVIGCRSNRQRAESLAERLRQKYGVEAPVVAGDILEEDVRRRLIEAGRAAGALYGLSPLVGQPARIPIETATAEDLAASHRENFIGPVLLARDFAAAVAGEDGAVVFVATMQAVGVFAGSTVYAAPKAALVHTARILARQWNLRINVIAPGVNDAGMAEQSVRAGKYDSFVQQAKIPRFGRPSDVARAIVFLLEPDNYITGQVLAVDGGLTAKM
jgi:NAD(P)-dependent dehydrogenase (short-subunit alcohol dehydrogenase family)